MKNPIQWFEIATTDIERAKNFYAAVFKSTFQFIDMGEDKMYMFIGNQEEHGSAGALVQSKDNQPSTEGTIIYFTCNDVADESKKVEEAGGKVVVPKTSIGEFGFFAHVIDTEGNRIGLHSHN